MITFVQPMASGNAIRLLLRPPAGATEWAVLRKETDDFDGHDDPDAYVFYEGDETTVVDHKYVINDVQYFYRPYYLVSGVWQSGATATGMATAAYQEASTDVLELLRDRLDYGLRVEIQRGALAHEYGHVPVLTAPPVFEDMRWPVVTVHLQNESPSVRGIGEMTVPDDFGDDIWTAHEGWLSSVQIQIVGWSLNADERIELRKAIGRIIKANLSLFDHEGMIQIEVSQQDVEDFTSFSAPVYQSMASFSCLAPSHISIADPLIVRTVNPTILES